MFQAFLFNAVDPRKFLTLLVGATAALAFAFFAFVLAVDPYDRGHGIFPKRGTLEGGPRTGNASRGRDPRFNAAVIGNSHAQLIEPAKLDAATGLAFVQLTVPGTGPREQFTLLDWFMRRHGGAARAVVLGVDNLWCAADAEPPLQYPFPFWLYEERPLAYASDLLRGRALRTAFRRVLLLVGAKKPVRPDGYWDYSDSYTRNDAWLKAGATMHGPAYWNTTGVFPILERLRSALDSLPATTRVVLYVPPLHVTGLPVAGSADAAGERACVAALQRIAAERPGTSVADLRQDNEATRDPLNFWDASHYAHPMARIAEGRIAAALAKAQTGQ